MMRIVTLLEFAPPAPLPDPGAALAEAAAAPAPLGLGDIVPDPKAAKRLAKAEPA